MKRFDCTLCRSVIDKTNLFLGLSDEDNVPAKKKSKPEQGNMRVSIIIIKISFLDCHLFHN